MSTTRRRHPAHRRWFRPAVLAMATLLGAAAMVPVETVGAANPIPEQWLTFHGDNAHTGVAPDSVITASSSPNLSVAWRSWANGGTNASKAPVWSSPSVYYADKLGKSLAIVGATGSPAALSAFDISNGQLVWKLQLPNTSIVSSPAIAGGEIYVGSGNQNLYEVNGTTGKVDCTYPTTGRIQDGPVVANVDGTGPVAFFGDDGPSENQNAGHEWAITGVGNTAGGCKLKWVFNGFMNRGASNASTGSWAPPALAKDSTGRPLLVFGSSNPDNAVYALDARTGAQVWAFQTVIRGDDEDVGAGAAISAPGVNGFADGVVYINGKDEIQYALDLLNGTMIWSYDLEADGGDEGNSVSNTALVPGSNAVLVGYSGFLYAFNATTGARLWRSPTTPRSVVFTSPVVSGPFGNRVALIADDHGVEWAFAVKDGAPLFSLSVAKRIYSSTAVSNGMAFFGADDGYLYALHVP